jgi:hypothetical protein
MRIVKIEKYENGAHDNQTIDRVINVPDGWAVIPDDMETPNFPFGDFTTGIINGLMTVTSWTPGEIPEAPTIESEPTIEEILNAMLGVSE